MSFIGEDKAVGSQPTAKTPETLDAKPGCFHLWKPMPSIKLSEQMQNQSVCRQDKCNSSTQRRLPVFDLSAKSGSHQNVHERKRRKNQQDLCRRLNCNRSRQRRLPLSNLNVKSGLHAKTSAKGSARKKHQDLSQFWETKHSLRSSLQNYVCNCSQVKVLSCKLNRLVHRSTHFKK